MSATLKSLAIWGYHILQITICICQYVHVDRHTNKEYAYMDVSILMFYYVLGVFHQLYIKPTGSSFLGQQLLRMLFNKYNVQELAHCEDIEYCK